MLTKTLFASFALTLVSVAQEQPIDETGETSVVSEGVKEILKEVTEALAEVEEYPITGGPFSIKTEISGILIPTKTQTVLLSPERWKSFTIESVPDHGAEIKAGEPLIVFKTEAINKALIGQADNIKSQELKLAIANRELTELQQKNALSLAGAKRRMDNAEADLAYHQSTALPARRESLAQSQLKAEDYLSYAQEELAQLLKMYAEDDLTEETEEIILTRQKSNVRNAENNLTDLKRRNAHTLEVTLPRELVGLQEKVETARIDYATAKLNLERSYQLKKLEVAKLERELADAREDLTKTEADRNLFDIVAEFDGNLLYGEFSDGQWKKGKTGEFLKKGKNVPTNSTVLTLVAKDSPLAIAALMDTEKAKELQASLAESGQTGPEVQIAAYPNLSGKHLVTLAPQSTEPFQFPGKRTKPSSSSIKPRMPSAFPAMPSKREKTAPATSW